ncbi:N-(5'phosphoribosyl)anthranilate (PRA) isomerase [Algibacter pectinivorans]|uniref:Multifunctional fusion protein n=2 Tax=Algibacter pectinivorans TaxID=870482 RepID=A0A1I1Q4G6_9FLAO|nr:tryptophan synthase subunit beta [Algibacter pectinivorans]SFD16887.1 N-(5'phosphoribosyl)anthranilate (PRA) isomerase [Algibacter pectinivorans]
MKYQDNIKNVAALQPDYLGFIFYEKSARNFDSESIPDIHEAIKKTGVFVDASLEFVIDKINKHNLQAVQLHGNESPEYCDDLKNRHAKFVSVSHPLEIIKVFSVKDEFNFNRLKPYEAVCDFFLFDTKGKHPGGNGYTFDWNLLNHYPSTKPFFLSGGIGLEEIEDIKQFTNSKASKYCYALDVNSKFEIEPGLKNIEALKAFKKNLSEVLDYKKEHVMNYNVNEKGYYGEFGGAFIPEMLYPNVEELRQNYLKVMAEPDFKAEFDKLLKDYVGRPSPLYFAKRLSEKYNTKIYLKREDLNHTGAHKINNTIGQILMAKRLGKHRIIAETGAGQHGVATATVCALMGLECIVYMGEIDIARQAPNVARMKMLGAKVVPALSGSRTLKDATNEAIRDWINNPVDTHYIIGSAIGPHPYPDMVTRFQAVISEEIKWQLKEQTGNENPDYLVACIGGGSNAAGTYYHYLHEPEVGIIAVEAAGLGVDSGESAATSVLGKEGIIHGCKTLLMQTQDGQITEPYSISAGLDYPGVGPMHAHLAKTGRAEFMAITDEDAMNAGLELCKLEGIIPAIESSHALAIFEQRQFKPNDVVVVSLSGRGDKDLNNYIEYFKI